MGRLVVVESTSVFKPDIFRGRVLFCTGGGSGICRGMTEAIVSRLPFNGDISTVSDVVLGRVVRWLLLQMRHGASAVIVGRK